MPLINAVFDWVDKQLGINKREDEVTLKQAPWHDQAVEDATLYEGLDAPEQRIDIPVVVNIEDGVPVFGGTIPVNELYAEHWEPTGDYVADITNAQSRAEKDEVNAHYDKAYPASDEGMNVIPPRAALLREAEGLITGDRNKSYGTPTQNFQNIADLLNVQFAHKLKDDAKFTAADVAAIQIHVKMARLIASPKRDNYVDIAGYAACGWEAEGVDDA